MSHPARYALALLVAAGCGTSSSPAPTAVTNMAEVPVAEAVPFGLDWLPADATTVYRFPQGRYALLLEWILDSEGPACVDELSARIDAAYQVNFAPPDLPVHVFSGDLTRADVEACMAEYGREVIGTELGFTREGSLTLVRLGTGEPAYFAYSDDGRITYGDERRRVEQITSPRVRLTASDPLVEWVRRLHPDQVSAFARTDYTSRALGVPSLGLTAVMEQPTKTATIRLVTASDDDAEALLGAISTVARDPALPESLGRAAASAAFRRDGADVVFDGTALFLDPGTFVDLAMYFGTD